MNSNYLKDQLNGMSEEDKLRMLAKIFPGKILFTTSFSIEDQVLSHMIFENDIPVDITTIDTGRLFHETYKVFNETVKRYNKKIKISFPDRKDIEGMVTEKGPFSFYYSSENRLECCRLRKVVPLNRILNGIQCWISGIRADQSENRKNMDWIEYDENRKLYKVYPLFHWTLNKTEDFIREKNIPYNILHDKGFKSIGCEPCTRAVAPGEDFRSGRWWWETDHRKECGLHIK